MIIVTGATGDLGSKIVDRLLIRVPARNVGVSVRDTARAADLADRGVRVRRGDFTDPASLATAFADATQVLIVSASTVGPDAVDQHTTAIDAARQAGAQRILYTSHQAAAATSAFAPMPDHAETEAHLARTGTAWLALRNGFYANTITRLLGPALETGELVAPADGPVSWTTHADLAEAAAILLTSEPGDDKPTPPLIGTAAIDLAGIADIVSEVTGRTIVRVVAQDDEWLAGLLQRGVPDHQAQMLLGMFRASRRGEFSTVSPALADLLGREPESVRSVVEELRPARA
jgi:NAD(P)H dehydrogenase (quinone)